MEAPRERITAIRLPEDTNPVKLENLVTTMLLRMEVDKISKMCMSVLPDPHECRRTGELPR